MQIIIPVDVKYKGAIRKAHTQFNCDSSDFQRLFKPLGAWAIVSEKEKQIPTPKKKKEST